MHKEENQEYLQLKCPNKDCGRDLTLVCPHCMEGALVSNDTSMILECQKCHNVMPGVTCSCGFTIKASYIQEKQRQLRQLQKNADPDLFKSVFKLLGVIGVLIWLVGLAA
jgi:hypothetical protein